MSLTSVDASQFFVGGYNVSFGGANLGPTLGGVNVLGLEVNEVAVKCDQWGETVLDRLTNGWTEDLRVEFTLANVNASAIERALYGMTARLSSAALSSSDFIQLGNENLMGYSEYSNASAMVLTPISCISTATPDKSWYFPKVHLKPAIEHSVDVNGQSGLPVVAHIYPNINVDVVNRGYIGGVGEKAAAALVT